MIYICTAMYTEARTFIEKLSLKKDSSFTKFQVFKNDDTLLFISGKGSMKAAIAVACILSGRAISDSDMLINIGLCASTTPSYKLGQALIINKITDSCTKRTYYPDILFKHPFKECSIETFPSEVNSICNTDDIVIDMESAGIYQSAITFMQQHQIAFIKIVSDYLEPQNISEKDIDDMMSESSDLIIEWIMSIRNCFSCGKNVLSPKEIETIDEISQNLKFSCTMKNELRQLVKYSDLMNHDSASYLHSLSKIKCSVKKEGMTYLEEIRQKLV